MAIFPYPMHRFGLTLLTLAVVLSLLLSGMTSSGDLVEDTIRDAASTAGLNVGLEAQDSLAVAVSLDVPLSLIGLMRQESSTQSLGGPEGADRRGGSPRPKDAASRTSLISSHDEFLSTPRRRPLRI